MSINNNLTIGGVLAKTIPFLAERGLPNPRLEADLMLAEVLDLPRVKLYSEWDRPLEPAELQRYREIILKRAQGWPLAYLTGKKAFLSWEFAVSPAVLIPRPETELLVEMVVDAVKGKSSVTGVDVGTGSGVIAISLAKLLPESSWQALDRSEPALAIARANAERHGVADRITFQSGDLLEPVRGLRFDLIVSNPPYIPSGVISSLQKEVAKEPVLALDGGSDGLDVYRRLLPEAVRLLNPGGWVAVEHGHDQREPLQAMFREAGLEPRPVQDLAGIDRILLGHRADPHG
jgi:release factor glutamine methyltransferase